MRLEGQTNTIVELEIDRVKGLSIEWTILLHPLHLPAYLRGRPS